MSTMEADLECIDDAKERYITVQNEIEVRPWLDTISGIEYLPASEVVLGSSSTASTVHGEVLQYATPARPRDIVLASHAIGLAEPQDAVSDEDLDEVPENPRLKGRERTLSTSDVAGVGGAFLVEQDLSLETGEASVGLAHVSVVTESHSDELSDVYPPISVSVHLDEERCEGFAGRPDTQADLNVITEETLGILGLSAPNLEPSDIRGRLVGVSEEAVPVLGWLKITFYLEKRHLPLRDRFYVIPTHYLPHDDAILSARLVKKYNLLEERTLAESGPVTAMREPSSQPTQLPLRQIQS